MREFIYILIATLPITTAIAGIVKEQYHASQGPPHLAHPESDGADDYLDSHPMADSQSVRRH